MYHTRRLSLLLLAIAAFLAFGSCVIAFERQPRNVILFIGDGMGIGGVTAARCMQMGPNGRLTMDTMPVTGFAKTHSQRNIVTDSAASGTALATGVKTVNGRISVDPEGKVLPTILELAGSLGKSAGVVTTDSVTGATPAVFYSHIDQRGKQDEIAAQLVDSSILVAMGSGKQFFVPASEGFKGRQDGKDLTQTAAGNGFEVVYDAKSMESGKSGRMLGLFAFDETGPTFEAMTMNAVRNLAKNPKGFFLMAESCLPDKGGHNNDMGIVVKGVLDLDAALRQALHFAARDGNTLVIVTADHDTGGLCVNDGNKENPRCTPAWVHKSHTGNMVPLYAYGPGAERFMGTHDNTQIPRTIADLWNCSLGR